ncbi:MAG: hypothetical protein JWR75_703 [Devosia sp.]|nr:hypothetical protein [Devosia sp.]
MRLLISIGALLGLLGATVAQESIPAPLTAADGKFKLATLGHELVLPLPDWLSPDQLAATDLLSLLGTTYTADTATARLEIVKPDETAELWTEMYAAEVTLDPAQPLDAVRSAAMDDFADRCKPELTAFFQFSAAVAGQVPTLGFVCGAFIDAETALTGQGEVMVSAFKTTDTGVAMISQAWRGAAFDPSKADTWPVATAVVEARSASLQDEAKLVVVD